MSYIEEVITKYKALPDTVRNFVGSKKAVTFMKDLEKEHNIELKIPVMLIAIKELDLEDVDDYLLKKHGVNVETAHIIKRKLAVKLFVPIIDYLYPGNDSKEDQGISEENETLIEVFNEKLRELITDKNTIDKKSLNERLIYLIYDVKGFKDELEKALYKNVEKLTDKEFIFGGKPHTPNVKYWLRDFIGRHGTKMIDNIILTDYMTNSENTKKLNEKEKNLVKKLLILYRNLKFFPESMKDVPAENWEIIPTDKGLVGHSKSRRISGPPKTEEEKAIEELRHEEEKYVKGSLEEKAIEEEINKEKRIEDLKIELVKYKEGSLEKRAIEEEISRLEEE